MIKGRIAILILVAVLLAIVIYSGYDNGYENESVFSHIGAVPPKLR